jgi:hypothetical protein
MKLENLSDFSKRTKMAVSQLKFSDVSLSNEFKVKYQKNREQDGERVTWDKFSSWVVTSGREPKNIYIPNYWFYVAAKLSLFILEIKKHREIFLDIFKGKDVKSIAEKLRAGDIESYREIIEAYFSSNEFSEEDKNNFIQCTTDYSSWGGAKTIDRGDSYFSAALESSNLLAESHGRVPKIALHLSEDLELLNLLQGSFSGLENGATKLPNPSQSSCIAKPFILLAGISGTGKSRFVRNQALKPQLFCSVAVRPDWHEPSDLLGYVSRLSGTPEYHATDVLLFFVKAWINACNLSETTDAKLVNISPVNMETYWLCLDEMNLAPVEQYFADYLSVIETREWNGEEYTCAPLLKAETFSCLEPAELEKLRIQLGINDAQYDSMWSYFANIGIPVPPNLIVAGTVNMDETTHSFSRKVIDRALTFDFGKFFPNDFDQYLEPTVRAKSFSFPTLSKVTKEDLSALALKEGGNKTIQFCKDLNNILKDSAFELAFRALNELLISLVCINPKDESELQAVWDDFLMTKVLPRIEGDADKLSVIGKDEAILEALTSFLDNTFSEIKTERIDFFREEDGKPVKIPCRSIAKIKWMQDRLNKATFTSFWP